MSIEEIQEMFESGTNEQAVSKLLHYAKNVPGTSAYWNQVKEQLKGTISQVGPPTIYWPMSCVELHWPEFHFLFDETGLFNSNSKRKNIVNNFHLLDWFFIEWTGIDLGMSSQYCEVQYAVMDLQS